ncbi:sigma-54 interaction domain-containing protein [Acetonema longum]|uniref:PAS modulated sigma54 specific transcriptional regulator, Fis family protein n=1 Tax=Acetonema longum DSM 6540 TaxID=1009370 RepID=F7NFK1_9FIRM|nr:sigma-54-dependent Fis family transcriptional regulator [Acetonema longum]EGO65200.1 PAS modulated sigma54 specific transcriptional regulator, Fis family protein [Acetonema longum DSM 6540]
MDNQLAGYDWCLDLVLNQVDQGIHIVDCEGLTIFYNQTAAEVEGLQPSDVIGKHVLQVYPSLTLETSSIMKVLASGKPILNQQQTIVGRNGRIITIHYSTIPLYRDGKLVGACDMSRDITKIKELSEQVMDLQVELLGTKNANREKSKAKEAQFAQYTFNDIMGSHEAIVRLKVMGQKVAASSSPVLVTGETGAGKELVVQAIHNASNRRNGPFIAQNCAAFPATLLESILFGTVKGSFTGAENRPGLFELADGGTLFLDEINSMPMELQGKLLRVLQDGNLRRVGDTHVREVDTRIITCTNVDPEEAVRNKELRIDLYYRLNVVSLRIAPLRERKSDIPCLVDHFIHMYNARLGCQVDGISEEVGAIFDTYTWPGNVRELQHAIEHAMNIAAGPLIAVEHLPEHLRQYAGNPHGGASGLDAGKSLPAILKQVERATLIQALERSGGNISRTALYLGIPRQTIQYKLKVHGLMDRVRSSDSVYGKERTH